MLVSVLINNYNYAKYLKYCIDSVINQTYENVEIIVYDDGSTDESMEILNGFINKISIIHNDNFGQLPIFNQANAIYQAFKACKGDIICLLDSDDAFYPNKVEKVVEAFKRNKDAVMVQNVFRKIDKNNNYIDKENVFPRLHDVLDYKKYIYNTNQLFGLFTMTSGISCRRTYLESILKPDVVDQYRLLWSDLRIRTQTIFYGEVISFKEPLGQYRIHGNNDSKRFRDLLYNHIYRKQTYDFFNGIAEKLNFEKLSIDRAMVLSKKQYFFYRLLKRTGLKSFYEKKYFESKVRKKNQMIKNYQLYYYLLNKWLQNKSNGKSIIDYFKENAYKEISIYGCGELGKRLYEDLKGTEIKVKCFIDQRQNDLIHIPDNLPVLGVNEIKKTPKVDVIVITPFIHYENITSEQNIRDLDVPIVSLEEIIYKDEL